MGYTASRYLPTKGQNETDLKENEPKKAVKSRGTTSEPREHYDRRIHLLIQPSTYNEIKDILYRHYKETGENITINRYINDLIKRDIEKRANNGR